MFTALVKLFSGFSLGLAASIAALTSTSTPFITPGPLFFADITPTTTVLTNNESFVATSTAEEISTSLHYKITQLRNQIERDNIRRILSLEHPPVFGDKSASVEKLQELLSNIGLLKSDSVTGYFGFTTMKAIQDFQIYYIIPSTGILDSQTLNQIIGVGVARENLASIYFPEEKNLLDVATTSRAEVSSLTDTLNYLTPGESSSSVVTETVYDCVNSVGTGSTASVKLLPATQTMISQGNPATLTWTGTNVNSCSAVSPANWTTSTATSGSQAVSPTTNSTTTLTYSIRCISSVGGASPTVSATVTVYPKHP